MPLPAVDAHAIAAFRRFYTLLPRKSDAALVVLKVHLLVEEQIRAFVDERLPNAIALAQAKIGCHTAICLAEALCDEDINPRVWEAARKLNDLRNKIAHTLEPLGMSERMNNVCLLIGVPLTELPKLGKSAQLAPLDNFIFAVAMLHGEVSMHVKQKSAEILHLVPPESDA